MTEISSSPEYYDAVDWEEESKKLKKENKMLRREVEEHKQKIVRKEEEVKEQKETLARREREVKQPKEN